MDTVIHGERSESQQAATGTRRGLADAMKPASRQHFLRVVAAAGGKKSRRPAVHVRARR